MNGGRDSLRILAAITSHPEVKCADFAHVILLKDRVKVSGLKDKHKQDNEQFVWGVLEDWIATPDRSWQDLIKAMEHAAIDGEIVNKIKKCKMWTEQIFLVSSQLLVNNADKVPWLLYCVPCLCSCIDIYGSCSTDLKFLFSFFLWLPGASCSMYNWGEPERAPHWSNSVPRDVFYVCIVRHSVNTPSF